MHLEKAEFQIKQQNQTKTPNLTTSHPACFYPDKGQLMLACPLSQWEQEAEGADKNYCLFQNGFI